MLLRHMQQNKLSPAKRKRKIETYGLGMTNLARKSSSSMSGAPFKINLPNSPRKVLVRTTSIQSNNISANIEAIRPTKTANPMEISVVSDPVDHKNIKNRIDNDAIHDFHPVSINKDKDNLLTITPYSNYDNCAISATSATTDSTAPKSRQTSRVTGPLSRVSSRSKNLTTHCSGYSLSRSNSKLTMERISSIRARRASMKLSRVDTLDRLKFPRSFQNQKENSVIEIMHTYPTDKNLSAINTNNNNHNNLTSTNYKYSDIEHSHEQQNNNNNFNNSAHNPSSSNKKSVTIQNYSPDYELDHWHNPRYSMTGNNRRSTRGSLSGFVRDSRRVSEDFQLNGWGLGCYF